MIRYAFNTLKTDVERYKSKVDDALRECSAQLKRDTELYKEDVCAQRKKGHIETARNSVKAAQADLAQDCRLAAKKMRDCLSSMTVKPVNPTFLENMRICREFGIKLDKSEFPALIKLAAGNMTALRILDDVAKASGFKLKYTSIDTFSADIARVERFGLGTKNYAPDNLWSVALEVLPNLEYCRADGTSYSMGRPTVTNFILGKSSIEDMLRDCDGDMLKRWTNAEVPSVEDLVERMKKENDGESTTAHEIIAEADHNAAVKTASDNISVAEDHSVNTEAEIERKKREREMYECTMKHYMR